MLRELLPIERCRMGRMRVAKPMNPSVSTTRFGRSPVLTGAYRITFTLTHRTVSHGITFGEEPLIESGYLFQGWGRLYFASHRLMVIGVFSIRQYRSLF